MFVIGICQSALLPKVLQYTQTHVDHTQDEVQDEGKAFDKIQLPFMI